MVEDGAFSHNIDNVTILGHFNLEGDPNCNSGATVMAIFQNGWILPIGGVALGRVCACSLRSRIVSKFDSFFT